MDELSLRRFVITEVIYNNPALNDYERLKIIQKCTTHPQVKAYVAAAKRRAWLMKGYTSSPLRPSGNSMSRPSHLDGANLKCCFEIQYGCRDGKHDKHG